MSPIRTLTSVLAFRTFLWISWHFAHFCGYPRPQTSMSKSQTHGNASTLFGLLCGVVFQTLWKTFDQEKSSCFDCSSDMPTIPLVWKWCHIYNLVLYRFCVSLCWYNVSQTSGRWSTVGRSIKSQVRHSASNVERPQSITCIKGYTPCLNWPRNLLELTYLVWFKCQTHEDWRRSIRSKPIIWYI